MNVVLAFLAVAGPNYLKGIIESDRALARTSRLRGVRWTYQRTFTGDAMVLTDQVQPAQDWLKSLDYKKTDEFFWDVNRAEISSKGEFGYTSGAWTLKRVSEYVNGDFVRVWKKQGRDWKLVFEADTTTDLPVVPIGQVSTPPPPKKTRGKHKTPPAPPLPTEDVQSALAAIETKLTDAGSSQDAFLTDAYFLRPNLPPAFGYTDDLSTAGSKPDDERFIVDKPEDLACSYGYLTSDAGRSPFLRVWRRTAGQGWQITLEYVGRLQNTGQKQSNSNHSKD